MLLELRLQNLTLIGSAELRLGPGLNVVTGETGAGKTILARSLDLLTGGKPAPGTVRDGADEAWVEGVFELPPGLLEGDDELAELRERLPDDAEVTLARRVGADGRSRAFIGGRAASAPDLRVLGSRLLSFYGQHEHRRLTLGAAQLAILDGFCGAGHEQALRELGVAHARVLELRRRLEALEGGGGDQRQADLLAFELEEIESLAPTEDERDRLGAERDRLRGLDVLRTAAGESAELLAPDGGEPGLAGQLAEAARALRDAAAVDPELGAAAERLEQLGLEADDVGAELRRYLGGLNDDPGRLEEVELRVDAYERLERKHGGSVAAVLAHAEHCRRLLAELDDRDGAVACLRAELDDAGRREDGLAARVGAARREAAPRLAERVVAELAELGLAGARFEVALEPRDRRTAAGDERVELLLAPNPGLPATPLRETASGGELSRTMLAIMSVSLAGGPQTVVFDEVDAGIGGRTARAVGKRLRQLASARQVLCITHLPQIASLADRHFTITKAAAGGTTLTTVSALSPGEVEAELVRMLGADGDDVAARRHARALLRAA